jgi:hypothetical protein
MCQDGYISKIKGTTIMKNVTHSANPRKNKKGTIPAFTPVPRLRERHDGWTPERQAGFIEALAELGSVKAAANRMGMTPEGAYLLRRHPDADEFRKAWEAALKCGVQRLEDVAMERALHGVQVPVYHFGEVIGTRTVYNDYLLMFLLRNRAQRRFAADSLNSADAATRSQLERLKKQWHGEWEEQQRVEQAAESKSIRDEMTRKLEEHHLRWWSGLSPRTRTAYRAFRRAETEDKGYDWRGKEEAETVIGDYDATFTNDPRAGINRLIEADAIGDDKLPPDVEVVDEAELYCGMVEGGEADREMPDASAAEPSAREECDKPEDTPLAEEPTQQPPKIWN